MKLIVIELKLFLRDPAAAFFTLAFPLILLVVNGTTGNQQPVEELGGRRGIDVAAPMLVALVVAMLGLTTLPPFLAHYRERGILRRMAATPVSPIRLLLAEFVVHLLVALFGLAALLTAGMALFGMAPPKAPVAFAIALLASSFAIFSLGFALAALAPTGRAASAVGLGLFFPMLYLSGTMVPREVMAEPLRRVGDWTRLAPVVRSLRETWAGGPLDLTNLLVLATITIIAGAVAARTFKW